MVASLPNTPLPERSRFFQTLLFFETTLPLDEEGVSPLLSVSSPLTAPESALATAGVTAELAVCQGTVSPFLWLSRLALRRKLKKDRRFFLAFSSPDPVVRSRVDDEVTEAESDSWSAGDEAVASCCCWSAGSDDWTLTEGLLLALPVAAFRLASDPCPEC